MRGREDQMETEKEKLVQEISRGKSAAITLMQVRTTVYKISKRAAVPPDLYINPVLYSSVSYCSTCITNKAAPNYVTATCHSLHKYS